MLDRVMLAWFILTALSVAFVALDIRSTPESPVLKWGFVLLTAYTGPLGALLYVLGCREPLLGTHERFVASRWRQVLGSTMHCVAGDGVGILVGAVIASHFGFSRPLDITLEYVLGFAFGWSIFQSLFMRDMAGGSYARALSGTFLPELLSMNSLMAGMVPVMTIAMDHVTGGHDPHTLAFWFIMSMALLVGFITAYPTNWWLVSHHMKHGMTTIRPKERRLPHVVSGGDQDVHTSGNANGPSRERQDVRTHGERASVAGEVLIGMTALTFVALGLGLTVAVLFGAL